jgi:hypothetical protein
MVWTPDIGYHHLIRRLALCELFELQAGRPAGSLR